ncbi:glycosyltransferase [bacterium]|nr:glycosyltransferase [bacterium]
MMIVLYFLCIGTALFYAVLLFKYRSLWYELPSFKGLERKSVSIIIPVRNEEKYLKRLFRYLKSLNYPPELIELILVDDHSEDNSLALMQDVKFKFKKRVLALNQTQGKKEAIKAAWEVAEGEILVQTDADCIFQGNWLNAMMRPFSNPEVNFVSGPVKFFGGVGLYKHFAELEFVSLIAIGAAHIQWGHPMICNGANMAYRKSVVEGADIKMNRASGEDVFLMKSIHEKNPDSIVFQKSNEALVSTEPPDSFKGFFHQRMRWASKNTEYGAFNTGLLGLVWLFNVLILINIFSFTSFGLTLAAFQIVLKILAETFFYEAAVPSFEPKEWRFTHIVAQVIHIPYIAFMPIISKLFKFEWKGRKLN